MFWEVLIMFLFNIAQTKSQNLHYQWAWTRERICRLLVGRGIFSISLSYFSFMLLGSCSLLIVLSCVVCCRIWCTRSSWGSVERKHHNSSYICRHLLPTPTRTSWIELSLLNTHIHHPRSRDQEEQPNLRENNYEKFLDSH